MFVCFLILIKDTMNPHYIKVFVYIEIVCSLYTSYRIFVKLHLFSKIINHIGLHIYIYTNKNNN